MSFKDVAGSHLLWVCVIVGIIGTLNYRVGERKSSLNYRVGTKSKKMSTKG